MKKKIVTLAILSAIATPALADNLNFTFYGVADVSYDSVKTGNGTTAANGATPITGISKRVISSNVSRFGFRGSEGVSDGLSVVWQVEQQINFDDAAANTFANRNTFLGLKSDSLGSALLGRYDTPYKLSTRRLDVFADSIADNRALIGTSKGTGGGWEQRPNNTFTYLSPSWSGVNIAFETANLTETNTAVSTTQANNSLQSVSVAYDVAPFYAVAAYEVHHLNTLVAANTSSGLNESAVRAGLGFKPEAFELNVVYEKTSDNLGTGVNAGGNAYGRTAYYVGGKYNIGLGAIKLAYGKVGEYGTGNLKVSNSDAKQASIGYDHGLTKRTKVYVLYTKLTNGKGTNLGFSAAANSGGATTSSGFGTSPAALSVGIRHAF